jgi:hypothetical protein
LALASLAEAIVPPAPVTFSTITGWPSALDNPSAVRRATRSVEPPAAKGTITVTLLLGIGFLRLNRRSAAWPRASGAQNECSANHPVPARCLHA